MDHSKPEFGTPSEPPFLFPIREVDVPPSSLTIQKTWQLSMWFVESNMYGDIFFLEPAQEEILGIESISTVFFLLIELS